MNGNVNYDSFRQKTTAMVSNLPSKSDLDTSLVKKSVLPLETQLNYGRNKLEENRFSTIERATSSVKQTSSKLQRPSLSQQLANITAQAETITKDIRSMAQNRTGSMTDKSIAPSEHQLIFTIPAKCFEIGSLTCRYPSPVFFYTDRCEYSFSHPFESSTIQMIMYYKDMISALVNNSCFKFKLPRKLSHFSADFDPSNPNHDIKIELVTKLNSDSIRSKIIPLINSSSKFSRIT